MPLQPLPPHSRKLDGGRTQVEFSRPNGRGTWTVHCTDRFVTTKGARTWAERHRMPGERASLLRYSPSDGWRPHYVDTLTDCGWESDGYTDRDDHRNEE